MGAGGGSIRGVPASDSFGIPELLSLLCSCMGCTDSGCGSRLLLPLLLLLLLSDPGRGTCPATVSRAGPKTASTMDVASVSAWSRDRMRGVDVINDEGVECMLNPWKNELNEGVSDAAEAPVAPVDDEGAGAVVPEAAELSC